MHATKPERSCAPHRAGWGGPRETATASQFRSPPRERFLPRRRAAPSGAAFFCAEHLLR